MKANINKDGVLIIQAENELESYALDQWCTENLYDKDGFKDNLENLIIDGQIEGEND